MSHPDHWRRPVTGILIVTMVIVVSMQFAAGFGFMKTDMHGETGFGGDVAFKAYVYAEEGTMVTVEPGDVPEDWTVTAQPATVTFPPDGAEYRYTETADGYRKAAPVRIRVDVPLDVDAGDYTVPVRFAERVSAEPGTKQRSSDFAVRHVQRSRFTVTVTGSGTSPSDSLLDEIGETLDEAADSFGSTFTGRSKGSGSASTDNAGQEDAPGQEGIGRNTDDRGEDSGETSGSQDQNRQGAQDADNTDNNPGRAGDQGLTGAISVNALVGSTAVQLFVFLLIWGAVGIYWYRRRDQSNDDERPWNGSLE